MILFFAVVMITRPGPRRGEARIGSNQSLSTPRSSAPPSSSAASLWSPSHPLRWWTQRWQCRWWWWWEVSLVFGLLALLRTRVDLLDLLTGGKRHQSLCLRCSHLPLLHLPIQRLQLLLLSHTSTYYVYSLLSSQLIWWSVYLLILLTPNTANQWKCK